MQPLGKAIRNNWEVATFQLLKRDLKLMALMLSLRWNCPPSPWRPNGTNILLGSCRTGATQTSHNCNPSAFHWWMLNLWIFGAALIPEALQILEATHPIFQAQIMKPFMGEKHPHLSCGNRHAIRCSKKDRPVHTVRVWQFGTSISAALQYFVSSWCMGYMVGVLPIVPQRCHLLGVWRTLPWLHCCHGKGLYGRSLGPKRKQRWPKATAMFWMKDSQIPMCYQDADMPLAKCSSKQVPNGDISSASLMLLLLPCCHFFLFHFACMATNQSWGPFTRPGAALLQGLCTALMLELAKTAKREVCRKCGGEHKPLPQAIATPSPSFQVFPLLATFLKQLPFSKALAICCQPFARHYMLPFSLLRLWKPFSQPKLLSSSSSLEASMLTLLPCFTSFCKLSKDACTDLAWALSLEPTAAFWDVILQWLQQCGHFDDPFGS